MSNETVSPISPDAALEQYYQGKLTVDELNEIFRSQTPPPLESGSPNLAGVLDYELGRATDWLLVKAGLGGPTASEALEAYYAYQIEAGQFFTAMRREQFRR